MKKGFTCILLAASVLFVACAKESVKVVGPQKHILRFVTEKPATEDETRTYWDGSTILWSQGDKIRVAYTKDGVWQNADGTASADEANGRKSAKIYMSEGLKSDCSRAEFTVSGSFAGSPDGSCEFYGVYPGSVCSDGTSFKYAPSLTVTLPQFQTPKACSFDPAADFMVGKSVSTYNGLPKEPVLMVWTRIVAHAQIKFKSPSGFTEGEKLNEVVLTADADADMTGKHYVTLDALNVRKSASTVANSVTLNCENVSAGEDGTFTLWASMLPCRVQSLTVIITTDKAMYTREITCDLFFKRNARNILTIDMSKAQRQPFGQSGTSTRPAVDSDWLELPGARDGKGCVVNTTMYDGLRNYTHFYETSTYTPLWTAYPLSDSYMGSLSRPSKWYYDPAIAQERQATVTSHSYSDNTYARGHMCPNASRNGNEQMQNQTFYVTNQVPQVQNSFNSGVWSNLENALQGLVKGKSEEIYVVSGVAFSKEGESTEIKYVTPTDDDSQMIPIPNYFYKLVLRVKKSQSGEVTEASSIGFWFENKGYPKDNFVNYSVAVDSVEAWTGFDFFVNLPDDIEENTESVIMSWADFCSF